MKPTGATRLVVRPTTQRDALAYVRRFHRHHPPSRGGVFCLMALDGAGARRGVAVAGRPVSRALDDGLTLEVLRVATDGHPIQDKIRWEAA